MSQFTGFSAFASHKSIATSAVQLLSKTTNQPNKFTPSPICTNTDQELVQIFKKIAKKDFITKSRALSQLASYCYPCKTDYQTQSSKIPKSEQVTAFSHFFFIFANKLIHDNNPAVRSEAINTLGCAIAHIPKACHGFLSNEHTSANVIGWVYSSQSSQTSEEAKIAAKVWKQLIDLFKESLEDVNDFICHHVEFILENSSRSTNLNSALFGNKNKAGHSNDSDHDEMEERYERVMLTTLKSLIHFIPNCPKAKFRKPSVLWKHLNSTRVSFRRETFKLLATISQHYPALIHKTSKTNLSQLILNCLSSERDPSNFGPLLEMILLFIASFRTFGDPSKLAWDTTDSDDYCVGFDANNFIKAISKALRRACYGSPVSNWGPTMLPILATLPTVDDQLHFVASLWGGKSSTIGAADTLSIVTAVTECSMYLLVREMSNKDEGNDDDNQEEFEIANDIAQMFLDCLAFYLGFRSTTSSSIAAEKELTNTIVRDIQKLNNISKHKKCHFNIIRDWFWREGFSNAIEETLPLRIKALIDGVDEIESKSGKSSSDLSRCIGLSLVRKFLPSVDAYPNSDEVLLMSSIFNYCTVGSVFTHDIELTREFCFETLLQWTVDACQLNALDKSTKQEKLDFFELVLSVLSGVDTSIVVDFWNLFLANDGSEKYDLNMMNVMVSTLVSNYPELSKELCGVEFDKWATAVAKSSEDLHYMMTDTSASDMDFTVRRQDADFFLNLCVGINHPSRSPLIGKQCIVEWTLYVIKSAADHTDWISETPHILLNALLVYASKSPELLSVQDILNLLIVSWSEGGPTWFSVSSLYLNKEDSLSTAFIGKASSISRSMLRTPEDTVLSDHLRTSVMNWADRCHRLFYIQENLHFESPCLALIGLSDMSAWKLACEDEKLSNWLLLCVSSLLQTYDTPIKRLNLIQKDPDWFELLISLFLASAPNNANSCTKCDHLFRLLGDDPFKFNEFAIKVIDRLVNEIDSDNSKISLAILEKGIALLDWIVGKILPKYTPSNSVKAASNDDIGMNDIKEGDELFYIMDASSTSSNRVKVTVLKVHADDFPNLYFSIKLHDVSENDGGDTIKQTIASRLKRNPLNVLEISDLENDEHLLSFAKDFENQVAEKLIKTNLLHRYPTLMAELLNTTISFSGLQGKGGIGTARFLVFQAFSALEKEVLNCLSSESYDTTLLAEYLSNVAISLGYGKLTSYSQNNCDVLQYDCNTITRLLQTFEETKPLNLENDPLLSKAIMAWITTASPSVMTDDNASFLWKLLENATANAIRSQISTEMFVRALSSMNRASSNCSGASKTTTIASEEACASQLVHCFIAEDEYQSGYFGECEIPTWYEPFRVFIAEELVQRSNPLIEASRSCANELLNCLDIPIKRWSAFHLLLTSAQERVPLFAKEDTALCERTERNLIVWQSGIDEEKAEEIEDDVLISAQWLPPNLMNELESWINSPLHHDAEDDDDYIKSCASRLLTWIIFLEILDTASSVDMRNRTHISSYIEKTNAISQVFDIAIHNLHFDAKDSEDLFSCISLQNQDDSFCLYQLSTLVVFRTMESTPTLCKSWWNEECPRSLQNRVTKFVETMVAPKTLERELQRINTASILGDLDVQGSNVSREVVATYVQDECNLSVKIKVPTSFPLRNVEVDCRNTLGVNEKRWRRWALQIMCMLNSQDGSILDALLLWKQNVDKEFEGIEPCPVCYSVLCVKTHAMPNLECKTCHNRFHTSCLFKWFNSSGKNQCVICQQPWSGTKVAS